MATSPDLNASLATLYSENHRWLRAWLYRQLRCPQDAADLTQDTFMRAMASRQLGQLEEPRHPGPAPAVQLLAAAQVERAYLEALAELPERFAPRRRTSRW